MSGLPASTIPRRLIFVWIGRQLPLSAQIALISAARVCAPIEILLLTRGLPSDAPSLEVIRSLPGFRQQPIDASIFEDLPGFDGPGARGLFESLRQPAALSNLVRLAELWQRGGVYLDTDTITVQAFGDLLHERGFIGVEPVAWPRETLRSRAPHRWAAGCVRVAVRRACLFARHPERAFERVRGLFPTAVNNAVIGAIPRNPVIGRALERIAQLSRHERTRRFRLGTHLMQEVTGNRSGADMRVLAPPYFYPLGPEISLAWFSPASADRLAGSLDPRTRVVHWYASVQDRLARPIERDFIEANRDHVAFARMAWPHLPTREPAR